ncbi:hypothetical protein VUR80DRAFT_979 [Thermomyces stellatus]
MSSGRFASPDATALAPRTAWNHSGRKYTERMKAAPRHSAKSPAAHTFRCRTIRAKRARSAAEAARRERIRAEAQGCAEPPCCSARRRVTIDGVKRSVPRGSRRRRRWGQESGVCGRRGSGKSRTMTRIVMAPWGKRWAF